MKLITTALLFMLSANVYAQTKGNLENPAQGSPTSGIYLFSGWACDAELIEIVIDGGSGLKASYGTARGDTESICGDSDNGFALLWNMSLLGTGEHTAVAFADGLEFGRSTFTVQKLSTGAFLSGEEDLAIANNFPEFGKETWLYWVESAQNYLIANEQLSPNPYDIEGIWWSDADQYVVSIATRRRYPDRVEIYAVGTSYDFTSEIVGGASEGYLVGDTATWTSVLPEEIDSQSTMVLVDATNAIIRLDRCVSYDPRLTCTKSVGATTAVRKLAGSNTGRAAPQDGTELTPLLDSLMLPSIAD
jgi:hypothetical protein